MKQILMLCFGIFAVVFYTFTYFYISIFTKCHSNNTEKKVKNVTNSSLPVVLQWNDIHWTEIIPEGLECPKKCVFTKTMKHESVADVILFYLGNGALKEIPKSRQLKRMNVFINFEAPVNGPFFTNLPKDFFNYTVTYRSDSNLPMPYDCLKELGSDDSDQWAEEEVEKAISLKNDSALFLVSHCKTDSKRELIVEKIKTLMNITQIGECNNSQCPRDEECEKEAIKSHFFYFAFENAVCLDYLTEKVFRLRQLIVPIILDRKVLRGENTKLNPFVIAVSDFNSIQELVSYLKMLMKNKNEYRKYFAWTKLFKKSNKDCVLLENIGCKMCDLAWNIRNGYRNVIPDMEFWHNHKQCKSDFGKNVV